MANNDDVFDHDYHFLKQQTEFLKEDSKGYNNFYNKQLDVSTERVQELFELLLRREHGKEILLKDFRELLLTVFVLATTKGLTSAELMVNTMNMVCLATSANERHEILKENSCHMPFDDPNDYNRYLKCDCCHIPPKDTETIRLFRCPECGLGGNGSEED